MNEFDKKYYSIKDVMKIQAKQNIREGFKKWGIERTEGKIKLLYDNMPKLRDFMITCYREILRGE